MFHTRFGFSEDEMVASKSKDPPWICLAQCFLLALGGIQLHSASFRMEKTPGGLQSRPLLEARPDTKSDQIFFIHLVLSESLFFHGRQWRWWWWCSKLLYSSCLEQNNLQFLIESLCNIHVIFHKCPGNYLLSGVVA